MTGDVKKEPFRSEAKGKIERLVRGSLLLILGAWMAMGVIRFAFFILRIQNFSSWFIADTVLRAASALFFIWVGARAIRSVGQEIPATRIGWGRLLLGFVLIYIQIRDHFVPNPNNLQPNNAGEAFGMQTMRAVLCFAGVVLIVAAFLKRKPQPVNLPDVSRAQ